jgi:thiol-disulfide isomerase/thioredoxin
MKKFLVILFLGLAFKAAGQKLQLIKLKELQQIIEDRSDKIQVINFWATWCAPCVKELPLFEKLHSEGNVNINVTLVSLDLDLDPNPEKVYKFILRKKLQSRVLLLDEQNPNSWIDKIDKNWSGALPATIVINQKTGQRKFIEKELHEGDLEKYISEVQ